ncbi:MAG: hypothetical protein J6Z38_03235 [Lachnospiraceae bacterium]|nr:hypothetical protein [Lachnospiraceae bacterium]
MLDLVGEWNSEDLNIDEMVTHFLQVNPSLIADSVQEHYRNLAALISSGICVEKYTAKIETYTNEGRIEEAARLYDQLSLIHPEEVLYRFNAGLAYEAAGNAEEAVNRYWQVVNLFPETNEAAESEARYLSMTGEQEVQGLPADVDAAAETAPVDIEALLSELPETQAPSENEGEPESAPEDGQEGEAEENAG